MAKLRFGSGTTIEAEVKPLNSIPVIGPGLVEKEENKLDVEALIQQVVNLLPKSEQVQTVVQEANLDPVMSELLALDLKIKDLQDCIFKIDEEHLLNCKEIKEMNQKLLDVQSLALYKPEVKQITHLKDVSQEVLEIVEDNKKQLKGDLMNHANHSVELQSQVKSQKIINLVLSGVLLLTIFLHLL